MKKQRLLKGFFFFLVPFMLQAKPDGNISDKLYHETLTLLVGMLEGEKDASFKNAVFHVENAYLDGQLSYFHYNHRIKQLAALSQLVAQQTPLEYSYNDSTNIQTNYGVASLLMDSVDFRLRDKELKHLPPTYDFEDFVGEKDWTKMFVSKLLEEGKGNCHSLPYLYKILVDELKGEAFLALAPHHIYIKTPSQNNKVGWYNTELTNRTHPSDAWIIASGYISLEAIQNQLYMQPLNDKASLALCLLDLAQGYARKFPNAENDFVLNCIDTALNYFPNCVNALVMKAELLYQKYAASKEVNLLCQHLVKLGYDQMPKSMYLDWLSRNQENINHSNKFEDFNNTIGNPFDNDEVLPTLSKGQYAEFHQLSKEEIIGALIFDTEEKKVIAYKKEESINPAVVSRFLSVDPLAPEYPWYTPYQFAGNTPIQAIDLDGLEPDFIIDEHGHLTKAAITLLDAAFVRSESIWTKDLLEKTKWVEADLGMHKAGKVEGYWTKKVEYSTTFKELQEQESNETKMIREWFQLIGEEEHHIMQLNNQVLVHWGSYYLDYGKEYDDLFIEKEAKKYGNIFDVEKTKISHIWNIFGDELTTLLKGENLTEKEQLDGLRRIGLKYRLIDVKLDIEFGLDNLEGLEKAEKIQSLTKEKEAIENEITELEKG